MVTGRSDTDRRALDRPPDRPDGCEAEVCMSHMDPVSGTDIDLFIEGIIPDSLHLRGGKKRSGRLEPGAVVAVGCRVPPPLLPVDELEYLLLLELVERRRRRQLLLFLQALLVQVTLTRRVDGVTKASAGRQFFFFFF